MSDAIPDEIMKAAREIACAYFPDFAHGGLRAGRFDTTRTIQAIARALMAADEAATKRASQWQPIETAPKDGTLLLLIVSGYEPAVGRFYQSREVWDYHDPEYLAVRERAEISFGPWRPTHWMPLPAPPILKGEA